MARPTVNIKAQPRELSRMRERLDEWRKGNARGVAFPEKLWASAGRLAQRHGVFRSARALGLEYNKLKRASGGAVARIGGAAKKPSRAQPVKFVELSGALPVSARECRLSLRNLSGQRLQLEMAAGAAAEVVLQLCRSGWGAS
ncbi:MAG TPA: hypothetical protein VIJ37_07520 [Steroidobacteraceae bacterium]